MTTEAMATPGTMSPWRSHGLLLMLAMMYADNFVGRQIVAVMIEPIKHEFGASDTSMGLISGLAFAAVFAVLGLPAGRLADRLPRIGLLAVSCLFWGIATILCGLTGSFMLLVRNRSLSGVLCPPAPTRNNPSHVHQGGADSDHRGSTLHADFRPFWESAFSAGAGFKAMIARVLWWHVCNSHP